MTCRLAFTGSYTHHVIETHGWQSSVGAGLDVYLEGLVPDGADVATAIVEHDAASPVSLAQQQQRGLVDAVGAAIARYLLERPGKPGRGGEQIRDMELIHGVVSPFDHARPPGDRRYRLGN